MSVQGACVPAPAVTLEVLPAGYGDCLLVTCATAKGDWRMLVDTGPDETYPTLRERLLRIPLDSRGRRRIDLFVVTHIDHDHIGAARLLLDDSLGLSFGDVWFNAPPRPLARGVAEGQRLAQILGADRVQLPWNAARSGKPLATLEDAGSMEFAAGRGAPTLTVLSPTPQRLDDLYKVWARELERLRRKERDAPDVEPPTFRGALPTLEELAERSTALDASVPNGSSIALLLEHAGASVLLAADAFGPVLSSAIRALIQRRGLEGSLQVDVHKLGHHGSRANVTNDLLSVVTAKHYVVSTNNAYFGHPNDEAIARVIVKGHQPTLWFNYDTPKNRKWDNAQMQGKYAYRARYPERANAGVTLELGTAASGGRRKLRQP